MIQRIQSVYLFLIAAISILMLFIPISEFELINKLPTIHDVLQFKLTGLHYINENKKTIEPSYFCLIIDLLIGLVSFLTIFLYKRRKHQIRHCWLLIFLEIILIALIFIFNGIILGVNHDHFFVGAYLPFLSIVFSFLALRAIKKDEELVRSLDRLR